MQQQRDENIWWARFFLGVLLILVVLAAYSRTFGAGFIWDDNDHLTKNPCIVGPLGFAQIWTSSHAYYYPLVLSTFRVVHKFVGLNPFAYHLLNVLMHGAAAVLLWRVLRQLSVRGAWFAAAVWALHPVMAQSVAWITELKNTQSCAFYLLSILFFLKSDSASFAAHRELDGLKPSSLTSAQFRYFTLAVLAFAMAISSKSSTVMLPVVLGLCLWWRNGEVRTRDLVRLVPFILISVATAIWTIWEQKFHSGALGLEFEQTLLQRFAIAGRDVWFYLAKLVWPDPLIFLYPRWQSDARPTVVSLLPSLAAISMLSLLWWKRNTMLRPVFFAAAYFIVSLFPVLDFFNVYFFRYSFVSDHFQYLAGIGPLALIGSGIASLVERARQSGAALSRRWLQPAICALLLIFLGTLTSRQTGFYHDVETLWRATIAKNPGCWLAHLNLGIALNDRGKKEEGKAEYDKALKINPDSPEILNSLGVWQIENGQVEEGIGSFKAALKAYPNYAYASFNLGNAMLAKNNIDDAVSAYQEALRVDPDYADANGNLAVALSQAGRLDEAVHHYKEALRMKPNDAGLHNNFGVVLAQQGRLEEAVQHYQTALKLDKSSMQTYVNVAKALERLGRKDKAAGELKEALSIKPDYAEAKELLRQLNAGY